MTTPDKTTPDKTTPEKTTTERPIADLNATEAAASESRIQLSSVQRSAVRDIVNQAVPKAEVFVFGSRATGRARAFSDLDLLFVTPARLSLQQRAELADGFEASDLPFCVDVVEADGLESDMQLRIINECIAL